MSIKLITSIILQNVIQLSKKLEKFKMTELKELPKVFGIKAPYDCETNILWQKYITWLETIEKAGLVGSADGWYYGVKGLTKTNLHASISSFDNTELTLKQWDKIVNNKQMSKKIIGYKLIKPEYTQACDMLVGKGNFSIMVTDNRCHFFINSGQYEVFRKAGVIDLWFQEIYEATEKVINMGSFSLTVKSEGIFHKSQNIKNFVEGLYDFYNYLPKKFAGYDCIVEDITFKKTGCEENKTFAKDWFNVWEEYQKFK